MGWVGSEYFRTSPDDPIWEIEGQRPIRYRAYRKAAHSRCTVRLGPSFNWCVTHWIPLFPWDTEEQKVQAQEINPPQLCEHCPVECASKGALKEHMRKVHKDVLEQRRREYETQKHVHTKQ